MHARNLWCAATVALLASSTATAQTIPRWNAVSDVVVDGTAAELSSMAWLRVGSDGTIWIPDDHRWAVRRFGANGRSLGQFGRQGDGPGEFRDFFASGLIGDSLWVYQLLSRRLTVIAPDGVHSRTTTVDNPKFPKAFSPALPKLARTFALGLRPGDEMIAFGLSSEGFHPMGQTLPGVPVFSLRTKGGDVTRFLGWLPTKKDIGLPTKGRPNDFTESPFPNVPVYAIAPDASAFVTVVATLTEATAIAQVTVVRAAGDTAFRRAVPVALNPIPKAVVDAEFGRLDAMYARSESGAGAAHREALRNAPRPAFYPPLAGAWISSAGGVLIAFQSDAADRDYLVIEPDGRPLAMFRLPSTIKVHQFDGRVLWTERRDRNDVPSIVRYRIGYGSGT